MRLQRRPGISEHTLDVASETAEDDGFFTRLTEPVRSRPLIAFFVLAYAISWLPAISYAITGSGPVILSVGPTLAAIIVLALTTGKRGLKSLFRAIVKWRVPLRWWLVAIFTPIVLSALATALNIAFGAARPTSDDVAKWTNILPLALIILLVPLIGGAWEEPGWRGYSLPQLLKNRSALNASLVLGVLWSLWHIPVLVIGDQKWSDLVLVIPATIVITWVFLNALSSVLVVMVLHALNNSVSGEYFSQWFEGSDSTRQSWWLVVVWAVAAALVVRLAPGFRKAPTSHEP